MKLIFQTKKPFLNLIFFYFILLFYLMKLYNIYFSSHLFSLSLIWTYSKIIDLKNIFLINMGRMMSKKNYLWTISRIIKVIYLFFITMVSVVQYLFLTSNFYHSWQKLNFFSLRGKSFFFLKSTFICYFSKLFCFRNSLWKVLKIAEEISVMIF